MNTWNPIGLGLVHTRSSSGQGGYIQIWILQYLTHGYLWPSLISICYLLYQMDASYILTIPTSINLSRNQGLIFSLRNESIIFIPTFSHSGGFFFSLSWITENNFYVTTYYVEIFLKNWLNKKNKNKIIEKTKLRKKLIKKKKKVRSGLVSFKDLNSKIHNYSCTPPPPPLSHFSFNLLHGSTHNPPLRFASFC